MYLYLNVWINYAKSHTFNIWSVSCDFSRCVTLFFSVHLPGSGSDYAPFRDRIGIPCVDIRYTWNSVRNYPTRTIRQFSTAYLIVCIIILVPKNLVVNLNFCNWRVSVLISNVTSTVKQGFKSVLVLIW